MKKTLNLVQSEYLFTNVPVCTYVFSNTRRMSLSVAVELFEFGKSGIKISQLLFSLIFSVVFLSSSGKKAG